MWLGFAIGSAFFAGVTSILAKCGIKKTDSNVATAVRTIVVLAFSWLMVLLVGSQDQLRDLTAKTLTFLVLSGLATGASWLCYFRALQLGDVNKVVPIDKFSTVLTIILAFIFFRETINLYKIIGIVCIAIGTWMMIQKKESDTALSPKDKKQRALAWDACSRMQKLYLLLNEKSWFFFASLSAVFASLTSILGKVGVTGIDSNLGTAIRTIFVLLMAWVVVFVTKKQETVRHIDKKELLFIILSGFATGASWLCYYRALQSGPASLIVPIDKLSIVVSITFSYFVFKERLTKKALIGLLLIVGGTLVMLI